jgi:hypothetical protein
MFVESDVEGHTAPVILFAPQPLPAAASAPASSSDFSADGAVCGLLCGIVGVVVLGATCEAPHPICNREFEVESLQHVGGIMKGVSCGSNMHAALHVQCTVQEDELS